MAVKAVDVLVNLLRFLEDFVSIGVAFVIADMLLIEQEIILAEIKYGNFDYIIKPGGEILAK